MKDEIKEILLKFNKEVEKAELTRNPYSSEDKKFKHILVSLSEEHFNIFKDTLDCITNLQEELKIMVKDDERNQETIIKLSKENERLNNIIDELILDCYNCDMTVGEFKNIWKKAYNKEYNSKDLYKLKELKEGKIDVKK